MNHLMITSQFGMVTVYRTKDISSMTTRLNGDMLIVFNNKETRCFNASCTYSFENLTKTSVHYKKIVKKQVKKTSCTDED